MSYEGTLVEMGTHILRSDSSLNAPLPTSPVREATVPFKDKKLL